MSLELAFPPPSDRSPLFRRLRFTPLIDVLRGRISGRLDFRSVIDRSTLPPRLKEVVRTTVRATKLWASERVDVARELVAHFEDGLAAGTSAGELLDGFGDSKRAARLIRRAKMRNRRLFWKAYRLVGCAMAALFAALLLTYGILAIRVWGATPTLSHDYLAELNAPSLAVPEAERAWPLYREAAMLTGQWPSIADPDQTPHGVCWDQWRAFADKNGAALELYHRAARRTHAGVVCTVRQDHELATRRAVNGPTESNADGTPDGAYEPVISVLLPQLSVFREAAQLAGLDARIGMLEHDADRVVTDLETIIRISEHPAETPFLISDLVSQSIVSRACDAIGAVLTETPELLSDEQLTAISHRLAALRGGGPLRTNVSVERVLFADLLQRMYTDDGHGDGQLARCYFEQFHGLVGVSPTGESPQSGFSKLVLPAASAVIAGRRETMGRYDELLQLTEQEAATPLWKRGTSQVDRRLNEMQASLNARARYPLVTILFPSLSRASAMAELATMHRDATLVALAAELHRRRAGAYPATIAELTPRYLPSVPIDRCDGQPLRYKLVEGRPLIYSIAGDRDDDGGRPPAGRRGNENARTWAAVTSASEALWANDPPDGDWVLWPPVIVPPAPPGTYPE